MPSRCSIGDFASGFGDIAARIDELVLSRDDASTRADASEARLNQAIALADASDLRLDELADRCDALSREVQRLVYQQSNEIFLAQPDLLAVRGPDGRTVLGFDETTPLGREGYRSFEDVFRGSEEFVRERQRPYLDLVGAGDRVADLGAGRETTIVHCTPGGDGGQFRFAIGSGTGEAGGAPCTMTPRSSMPSVAGGARRRFARRDLQRPVRRAPAYRALPGLLAEAAVARARRTFHRRDRQSVRPRRCAFWVDRPTSTRSIRRRSSSWPSRPASPPGTSCTRSRTRS